MKPALAKRIGVFGGSFDPVHNAHVALACIALETLALDELRWIPAGQAWQKTRVLTAAVHRVAMIELAIAGEPRFALERCELERSGPSYTLETVRELRTRDPQAQWFLVIGQDQLANLHTWYGWQELLSLVTLAVAARPGAPLPVDPLLQARPYQVLPLPTMAVSASAIRERAARGEAIDDLVPPAVARYIARHGLYLPHGASPGS